MRKPKFLYESGFLGTGIVSRTFLAGLQTLGDQLGPVYSPTARATPRVVRALKAGFVADSIVELAGCRRIFVCAPADETKVLLAEAQAAGVFENVDMLVLVESSAAVPIDDGVCGQVHELGRLTQLPNRADPAFLVEGSLRFRRFSQQLLKVPLRRLVMAEHSSRPMVTAGLFMAEEFCLPLFEAVQGAFMLGGIPRDQARDLSAELLSEAVGNAHFAGRKRWTGILHQEDRERLAAIVEALRKTNNLMADLVLGFTRQSLAVMGKDTDWMEAGVAEGAPGPVKLEAGLKEQSKRRR